MAPRPAPHETAHADQLRAFIQGQLDEFVSEYRTQLDAGDDPNKVFDHLYRANAVAIGSLGPMSTNLLLCAAVERLARGDA